MTHEESTLALENDPGEGILRPEPLKSLLSGNPPPQSASQPDAEPASRDLAAVIDAMLAEIPSSNNLYPSLVYWRQIAKTVHGDLTSGVANALIQDAALGEPWYDRVMAIWSGEAHFHGPDCASDGWTADCGDDGSLVGKVVVPYSPTHVAILEADAEATKAILESPDHPFSPTGDTPSLARGLDLTKIRSPISEVWFLQTEEGERHSHVDPTENIPWVLCTDSNCPTLRPPNLAGEAWAGYQDPSHQWISRRRHQGYQDPAFAPVKTFCADCGGQPDLILLAQDCAKCVRCFILAGMNSQCFMCKKNPTEAIVRAIHPGDGKDDTVGCCVECLLKQVSAGRN